MLVRTVKRVWMSRKNFFFKGTVWCKPCVHATCHILKVVWSCNFHLFCCSVAWACEKSVILTLLQFMLILMRCTPTQGNGGSMVKVLCYWSEGCEIKSQHCYCFSHEQYTWRDPSFLKSWDIQRKEFHCTCIWDNKVYLLSS